MCKHHFIVGLVTVDLCLPLHLSCRFLLLETNTMSIMRPSCINPKIPPHGLLNGVFECNKTLLALQGCKIVVHENRNQRSTWDPHLVTGWNVRSADDHFRCYNVCIPNAKSEWFTKIVRFFPHKVKTPYLDKYDEMHLAAKNILKFYNLLLCHPYSKTKMTQLSLSNNYQTWSWSS